jgi:hypothetical protein
MLGNIVKSSRPEEGEGRTGICEKCGKYCEESFSDCSFADQFGWVEDWESNGSDCCGYDILEDEEFTTVTRHKARQDHKDGRIKKGDYYRKVFTKGYQWQADGTKEHYQYSIKQVIRRAGEEAT